MDLYEALKAGTSAEELSNFFNEELKKAQDQLNEEQAAAEEEASKKERVDYCRNDAIVAIINYTRALLDEELEDWDEAFDILENYFKELEEELEETKKMHDAIEKTSDEIEKIFSTAAKDENNGIIKKFFITFD